MDKDRKLRACLMPSCSGKRFDLVHKFPMDNERAEMWRTIVNVPDLFNFSIDHLRKRMFLCSKHFHQTDYKNTESRSLNKTAIPSLFLNNVQSGDYVSPNMPQQCESESILPSTTLPTPNITLPYIQPNQSRSSSETKLRKKRARTPETKAIPVSIKKSDCKQFESNLNCSLKKAKFRLINADIRKCHESRVAEATTEPTMIANRNSDLVSIVPMSTENFILLQSESLQTKPSSPTSPTIAVINSEHQRFFIDDDSFIKQPIESMIVMPCETIDQLLPEPQDYLTASSEFVEIFSNKLSVTLKLSNIWLRDHCRCSQCYDSEINQRKCKLLDVPLDIRLEKYQINDNQLQITWNDSHESNYYIRQLHDQQSDSLLQRKLTTDMMLWGHNVIENASLTHVTLNDLLCNDEHARSIVTSLVEFGVAFIEKVPPNMQMTEIAIKRLFEIQKTPFGKMWSTGYAQHSEDRVLEAHTSHAYFNDAAGLQALHCVHQSGTGGNCLLIDGFKVISDLKAKDCSAYDRLCRYLVTNKFEENGKRYSYCAPIIKLDAITGCPEQVRFNLSNLDVIDTIPQSEMLQFYKDVRLLAAEFQRPNNEWWVHLQPGTVLLFDNWRLLHGRTVFSGQRNVIGCYVSRTEFMSIARTMGIIS